VALEGLEEGVQEVVLDFGLVVVTGENTRARGEHAGGTDVLRLTGTEPRLDAVYFTSA